MTFRYSDMAIGGDAMTLPDIYDAAFKHDVGGTSVLMMSAEKSLREGPGIGFAYRELTTDQGRRQIGVIGARPPKLRFETDDELRARGDEPLTERQFRSSEFFRPSIAYDQRMTRNRARALAEGVDYRQYKDRLIEQSGRPFTALAGGFAGAALDPINYIPIVGPEVRAAAILKWGIAGRAAAGAADAALNVGIFSALTLSERQAFGDEVTWQSTVTDIAMAALAGAAFHGIAGALGNRRVMRAASDLDQVARARANLNEAVEAVVNDRPVDLSRNALKNVSDFQPKLYAKIQDERITATFSNDLDAGLFKLTDAQGRALPSNDAIKLRQFIGTMAEQVDRLPELYAQRNALISLRGIPEIFRKALPDAEAKAKKLAALDKEIERIEITSAQFDNMIKNAELDEIERMQRLGIADQAGALRKKTLQTKGTTTAQFGAEAGTFRSGIGPIMTPEQLAERLGMADQISNIVPPGSITFDLGGLRESRIGLPQELMPRALTFDGMAMQEVKIIEESAVASINPQEPQDLDALAKEVGLGQEDGSFELDEIKRLEKEERIAKDDIEELAVTRETIKAAKSYGDALRGAFMCLVR